MMIPKSIERDLVHLDDVNCDLIRIVGALRVAAEFLSTEAETVKDDGGYPLKQRLENGCFSLDVAIGSLEAAQERLCTAKDMLWASPEFVQPTGAPA